MALFGTNLTNETVIGSGASALSSLGLVDAGSNPPRQYGGTVKYAF